MTGISTKIVGFLLPKEDVTVRFFLHTWRFFLAVVVHINMVSVRGEDYESWTYKEIIIC